MKFLSNSLSETETLAQLIAKRLQSGDIIAFEGGMGAGKTTFTKSLVKNLGYNGEVTSPTFTLINEYPASTVNIYHFDLYRIADPDDLYSIGFYDYLDGNGILIVEWSENIKGELPDNTIIIKINRISENVREFVVEGDDRFENIGN